MKLDWARTVWYQIFHFFDSYSESLISEGEAGY